MGRPEGPEGILSRLVNKDPITYKRWQLDKIVAGPRGPGGQPNDTDALEVGAAAALIAVLGDEDGRTAWRQVKAPFFKGEPADTVRVAWREPYEAVLCRGDVEVGRAAIGNERPILVIDIGAAALEARRRFRLRKPQEPA